MPLTLFQYNIASYLLLIPVILNLFTRQSPLLAAIFGGIFFFFQSLIWGDRLMPRRRAWLQLLFGAFFVITVLLILSASIYLLQSLSLPAQAVCYLLIPVAGSLLIALLPRASQAELDLPGNLLYSLKEDWPRWGLLLLYAMLCGWLYAILGLSATTEAITSPWQVIPLHFWPLYFIATVLAFTLLLRQPNLGSGYLIAANHLFLTTSIAWIIYQIGYGFDPFLHQAAEQVIHADGVVLPKTPYYIGQYGLVVSLHRLLGIPLLLLDRLLVPALFALLIPLFLSELAGRHKQALVSVANPFWLGLAILVIPFSAFILTTPQGLANLFLLLTVLAAWLLLLYDGDTIPAWTLWLCALAAVLTHPLAGIPALIVAALATYEVSRSRIALPRTAERILLFVFFALASISTPLLFVMNGRISPQFTTSFKPLSELSLTQALQWIPVRLFPAENQFRFVFFEFGYFVQENIWWMLTLVLLVIIYWLWARSRHAFLRVFGLSALILLANAMLLSSWVDFPELIQYESLDYAGRLFAAAFWTSLPLLFFALIWVYRRLSNRPMAAWIFLASMAWLVTGSLFASYPRNNRYELGRQHSVSAADIAAVHKIGLKKTDFVVLANQSVSAAAIKEFGFKKYYELEDGSQMFYYPVPTSSPLYDRYLTMVYDMPSRENAQAAADLAGVDTVYFVLNAYWDNAPQIAERAKLQADEWVEIENGLTTVFTYKF